MTSLLPLEDVARAYCASNNLSFCKKAGEGAFKETFEVLQPDGRKLALKVCKPGMFSMRNSREIQAMIKCHHANIARLVAVAMFRFETCDYNITLEEFLSGGTLTHRGKVDRTACLEIGRQLIDALEHIAEAGLVHRDLKPDNIMFRCNGNSPVVVDFGVVRNLTDTSLTPSWAPRGPGTPIYSSPEQLNNEKHQIDWRSDQFSLGVLLSEAVLGEHPYQLPGMPAYQVVERVAAREPINPSFVDLANRNGLPALASMVAVWAVQRYRTPRMLQEAWVQQIAKVL